MSKCVVPAVVVGKKEDGLVWSTNNERMHVGKFVSMGDVYWLDGEVGAELEVVSIVECGWLENALVDHQCPLRGSINKVFHFA